MKIVGLALFCTLSLCPIWAQIAQTRPEYCGIPGNVNPPLPDITASLDPNGRSVLYVGHGSTATALTLPDYFIVEISEVCPLSDGRLVVFGDFGPGLPHDRASNAGANIAIYVIDARSLVDSFWAYRPVLSPNQRWIAFTKWYPYYVQGSDEIMLYDLSKSLAQNRPPSDPVHPNDPNIDAGTIIFPPGHENFTGSNIVDTPPDQIVHNVSTLHWASDSRSIVFKDVVANNTAIVLVTLDEHGTPSVLRRGLTPAEICDRDVATNPNNWLLDQAEFGSHGAIRLTVNSLSDNPARVGSQDERCTEQVLELRQGDFEAMAAEVHVKPTYPAPTEEDLRLHRTPRKDRKGKQDK